MNTTADRVKDTSRTHATHLKEILEQKDYQAVEQAEGKQARPFPAESGVRRDLVRRIQAEIRAGTYVTEERLAAAADHLADELFPELQERR